MSYRILLMPGLCLSLLISGCSSFTNPPFQLADTRYHLVWPRPPETPRIRYLGEIDQPAQVVPERGKIGKLFDLVTGESRSYLEFVTPYAVAVSDDVLYVADTAAGVVQKLDLSTREVSTIIAAGSEPLMSPAGLAVDGKRQLYVSDSVARKVYVYRDNGELVGELSPPSGFQRPAGIAVTSHGSKYVVDVLAHKLYVFDENNRFSGEFPHIRKGEELNFPTHVAVDRNDYVYVTDAMNFMIRFYDPQGNQLGTIGEIGDAPGSFARPKGVAVDSDGHIYVVDATFDNFQIFDRNGRLLLFIGKNGKGPGEFFLPSGIFIDSKDRIFITDSYNRRVQVFQYLKEGLAHVQ